jgi:hypothetical protein
MWLEAEGWTVEREVDLVDVTARRGDERLFAEVKGRTTEAGLDVDTLYGQLLRRMPAEEVGMVRFGVVVPQTALTAALRVSRRVRDALRIDVFAFDETGAVEIVD